MRAMAVAGEAAAEAVAEEALRAAVGLESALGAAGVGIGAAPHHLRRHGGNLGPTLAPSRRRPSSLAQHI